MKLLWLVAAVGGAGLAAGLAPPGALFLGIDLSTQSCTAVVVDARLDVVHRHSVNFDERFPEYGTESGYHAGDDSTATSPVAMWLDGLDRVLDELPESLLQQVDAISFSGQQHGAVYWSSEATRLLKGPQKGEEDEFIPAKDIAALQQQLAGVAPRSEVKVYAGAGHAFMNETREEAFRPEIARDAWARMVDFFRGELG